MILSPNRLHFGGSCASNRIAAIILWCWSGPRDHRRKRLSPRESAFRESCFEQVCGRVRRSAGRAGVGPRRDVGFRREGRGGAGLHRARRHQPVAFPQRHHAVADSIGLSDPERELCARLRVYLFIFLASNAAGAFFGGPLGDRFGRKYVIWFSILGALPFTLALPYAGLYASAVLTVFIGFIISSAT